MQSMKAVYLALSSVLIFASNNARAAEHWLVVQAVAAAAYDARMQLLIGTDDIFTSAYYAACHADSRPKGAAPLKGSRGKNLGRRGQRPSGQRLAGSV